jgi:hypothetical protein
MNNQVTCEDEQRRISAAEFQTLGDDFNHRRRQHETCSQCDKIFEVRAFPVFSDNDGSAKHVGSGGSQAEQKTEQKRVHGTGIIPVFAGQNGDRNRQS